MSKIYAVDNEDGITVRYYGTKAKAQALARTDWHVRPVTYERTRDGVADLCNRVSDCLS